MNAVDGKTANCVVIGHLAMPPVGFVELYNQMTAVVQRLTKAGKVCSCIISTKSFASAAERNWRCRRPEYVRQCRYRAMRCAPPEEPARPDSAAAAEGLRQ